MATDMVMQPEARQTLAVCPQATPPRPATATTATRRFVRGRPKCATESTTTVSVVSTREVCAAARPAALAAIVTGFVAQRPSTVMGPVRRRPCLVPKCATAQTMTAMAASTRVCRPSSIVTWMVTALAGLPAVPRQRAARLRAMSATPPTATTATARCIQVRLKCRATKWTRAVTAPSCALWMRTTTGIVWRPR